MQHFAAWLFVSKSFLTKSSSRPAISERQASSISLFETWESNGKIPLPPNLSSAVCSYYCCCEYGAFERFWAGINKWLKTGLVFCTPRTRKISASTTHSSQPTNYPLYVISHNPGCSVLQEDFCVHKCRLWMCAHPPRSGRSTSRSWMAGLK